MFGKSQISTKIGPLENFPAIKNRFYSHALSLGFYTILGILNHVDPFVSVYQTPYY